MRDKFTLNELLLVALLMLVFFSAQAQEKSVSGQVTGEQGETLPGVSILVEGTTSGTVTDFEGKYSLSLIEGQNILVFSSLGYKSQTIEIGSRTVINLAMEEDIEQLEEIVVIGYGTQQKKDITGAMTALGEESFNKGVVSNPLEMIQGRATGVQITQSSGAPGAAISVKIRGNGSIRSSNDPLYVVDGVPLSGADVSPAGTTAGDLGGTQAKNPLNFLNPNDIESIDILKDASATAIYGSRGANGVVMITTKRGKAGSASINYSGYASLSQVRKKIDVLSAKDWRSARTQLAAQTGNLSYLEHDYGASTDWQDQIFRPAISQNHGVSISGGSQAGNYRASVGYMDQQGIIESSSMKRISARINLNQTLIEDRLNVGLNLTVSNIKDRNAPIGDGGGFGGDVIYNALTANPTWPVKNNDGSYYQFSDTERNPTAMIDLINDRTKTDRVLGNITTDFKIIEGLNFHVNLGVDKTTSDRAINFDKELLFMLKGYGEIRHNESINYLMEDYLQYDKIIGDHQFSIMGGYSYQYFETSWHSMVAQGFVTSATLPTDNIGSTDGSIIPSVYSGGTLSELQSFYGRANYNYKDKYLATASIRMDGSSRFGPDNRYGYFPSAALGWRMSEEGFLAGNGVINNLKLRVGYGETGNQEIPDYIYDLIYEKDNTTGGVIIKQVKNGEIQWESTRQINVGLDFGLWGDRISGTLDYFNRKTTDLLYYTPLPDPTIVPFGWQNIDAVLINKGIEASVSVNWLKSSAWDWSTTVNFTMIDNIMEDFTADNILTGQLNGPGLTATPVQVLENGYPSQTFKLREFLGYDSEGISIYANDGELAYVGNPYSDFDFSINNAVKYKAFDFSIFIDAKKGNLVYNNTANALFNKSSLGQAKNITYDELNAPRSLSDAGTPSTKYLEDASFIRLSNVTFGWNIPNEKITWMNSPRVYVTGQNLFVITDYSGYDPEVNTNKALEGIPSAGIDYTSYPRPTTLLIGFSVNF
ncbi:iron complex outermembrane recepter protein [Reichenbachiella faecimaris]|uniref:Iron complex outermembrane recepter protein n=1 Tax=Reichenbachiella faecimaris TaxID=692418 RepID=A0A1W2G7W9_REIFA|nr:TonB-dependent receptor [Reichenbachiella faecimaris]SMD32775.1 iron complex outermembrane recepter protein [Reichenbachiella faecimaris]